MQDAASTQVHCSLQIDPITVSITPAIASHLAAMLALPPQAAGAGGAGAAAWGGGAAAVAAEPCLMPGEEAVSHPSLGSSPMGPGLMGSSTGSSPAKPRHMRQSSTGRTEAATALGVGCGGVAAPGSGSSGRPKPAPAVVVDVRLTSLDASYFVQGSRVGKVEAHAHFSLLRAQAALQVYPTGVEAQVRHTCCCLACACMHAQGAVGRCYRLAVHVENQTPAYPNPACSWPLPPPLLPLLACGPEHLR